jgi:Trk-type K+ transport system membrane component
MAVFENQDFDGDFTKFRTSLNGALTATWMPLIQTTSATTQDQNYIFLREASDKFNVLVITITSRDATVVQVNLSRKNLALLLKDPEGTGKSITEEATIIDQE